MDLTPLDRHPMVVPDPQSEIYSMPTLARYTFLNDKHTPVPQQVRALLRTTLREGTQRNGARRASVEYSKVWKTAEQKKGLTNLGTFTERLTSEAGSRLYLAPTPLIRANVESVARAFRVGWRLTDQASEAFDQAGPHFVIHSEVFGTSPGAVAARAAFISCLRNEYATVTPRKLAFLSLKVFQSGTQLLSGPSAPQARRELGDFMVSARHQVGLMGGDLIAHNWGTLALGPLSCGADLVSYRGNGVPFHNDVLWHRVSPRGKLSETARRRKLGSLNHKVVPPFDPHSLSNGDLAALRKTWEREGVSGFSTAEFVEPEPIWEKSYAAQFEYRTRQIISGLHSVGVEFRAAVFDGDIPLAEALRSRISRMREQDALLDLVPQLWGVV
jgi:hypothetical protein